MLTSWTTKEAERFPGLARTLEDTGPVGTQTRERGVRIPERASPGEGRVCVSVRRETDQWSLQAAALLEGEATRPPSKTGGEALLTSITKHSGAWWERTCACAVGHMGPQHRRARTRNDLPQSVPKGSWGQTPGSASTELIPPPELSPHCSKHYQITHGLLHPPLKKGVLLMF